jgi:hypothetical protein
MPIKFYIFDNHLVSPCPPQRRGFKERGVKVLSFGEDLGEAELFIFD